MNGNGTRPLELAVDLTGVLTIALDEARDDLARRADRVDALRQLRDRAVALAIDDDELIVTGALLWESAVDETDRALLDALLQRATVDLPEPFVQMFDRQEEL